MFPKLIEGGSHQDKRGTLNYNNNFDAASIKRIYTIQNTDKSFVRRWQGHKIEQRWFTAVLGDFRIELIKIDNWNKPSKKLEKIIFEISEEKMDILYIPKGYVSSIQALTNSSKLLVMADYKLNEINDEYKFSPDYFND